MNKIQEKIAEMNNEQATMFCRRYPNIFRGYSKKPNLSSLKTFMIGRLRRKNSISGGYGDNLDYDQIILKELDMGIKVEYEHTDNYWKSVDIAFDHLAELPDYYTRLARMEESGEEYWNKKSIKAKNMLIKMKNKVR